MGGEGRGESTESSFLLVSGVVAVVMAAGGRALWWEVLGVVATAVSRRVCRAVDSCAG